MFATLLCQCWYCLLHSKEFDMTIRSKINIKSWGFMQCLSCFTAESLRFSFDHQWEGACLTERGWAVVCLCQANMFDCVCVLWNTALWGPGSSRPHFSLRLKFRGRIWIEVWLWFGLGILWLSYFKGRVRVCKAVQKNWKCMEVNAVSLAGISLCSECLLQPFVCFSSKVLKKC